MKIVKLSKRFKQCKEHGHVIALKFDHLTSESLRYERACRDRLGGLGWDPSASWYTYYGARNRRHDRDAGRPLWITFRNESDLTMLLLSVSVDNKARA